MPQIERPTHRLPLRDLPLSLFIHPSGSQTESLLGKKRPYSPSSIVSPSKRRLLAVEGVLSPRSPFKKAVNDLKRALPSLQTPGRNLLADFQRSPVPAEKTIRQPSFVGDGIHGGRTIKPAASTGLLAPSVVLGQANQPKPRMAAEPSKAEAELLAMLANAPKPTMMFLPGEGHARPMRSKEDDPEEVHYPGFDICADEDEESSESIVGNDPQENMDAEDEDEEVSKENQAPHVSVPMDQSCTYTHHQLQDPLRFATPTLSARSSMSSLGAPPRRRTARDRLQAEVDGELSDDDEFL